MSENFCEYIIRQKSEGAALVKKILLISAYVLIFAIPFSLALLDSSAAWFIPTILISAAADAVFIFITWRFLSLEFEFIIDVEDITVSKIWGGRIRKKIFSVPIEKISEIGLYDDAAYEEICKMSIQENHVCVSSLSAPVMYYAIYSVEKDQSIFYFEATEEAIALLKKRNSSAFRVADNRFKNKTN
jgi:hypothetical protein